LDIPSEAVLGSAVAKWAGAPGRRAFYTRLKPALDFVLGLLLLIATLPAWLVIAIAIKLESPGPILFVQERVGEHRRSFRMYKFRSMYRDAESRLEELRHLSDVDGPVFKIRSDPRVTRVGKFLRRTSLDELPQLLNVLRGEMAVVGPRPPLPREVLVYRPSDMVRLTVRPGLTCLWQVSGRSDTTFDRWMELDREYVARRSAWLDMSIIVRTAWVVVRGRGAY
jgi:lipopolysaccharide/colanic/teichoic acid biosynthesis glycosyltransferase